MSYKRDHCKPDGTQLRSNLTVNQQIGLRTLTKKVAELEVIVIQADKGKKFVVVDQPTYLAMGLDHVSKAKEVSPADVRTSQRILSSTARSLVNVLGLGSSSSHAGYVRCLDNAGSGAEDVPVMKLLPKVHKPVAPGGQPQSRPVCHRSQRSVESCRRHYQRLPRATREDGPTKTRGPIDRGSSRPTGAG